MMTNETRRAFWERKIGMALKERAQKQNKWRRHVAS